MHISQCPRSFALVFALTLLAGALAAQSDTARNPIIGTWEISFYSSANPPAFKPIPGLITFTSDGTVIESDGGEVAPTSTPVGTQYGTTGQGVWQDEGEKGIHMKLIEIFANSDNTLGARGVLRFALQVNEAKNTIAGEGNFVFYDPKGNVLANGTENIRGWRVHIE